MAIACAFGIYLYNFCAHCHFYLLNSIENKWTQSAVETIKVNDVLEVNIFASEGVFGIFAVLLERISVCTKPIVADIEKISSCLAFIIKNKPPCFSRATARRESTASLYNQFYQSILLKLPYKNSKTSPGALFNGKRGRSYQLQR